MPRLVRPSKSKYTKPRRVRFRFRPDPKPPIDIDTVCRNIAEARAQLNDAKDALRATVTKIAGCDISEWSMKDVMEYADGMLQQWHKQHGGDDAKSD